ncbi:MAG: hypothetical protein GY936_04030 [Ignavibacteriae bacterium]|nr:hypothetical protein [Ignavibacteriota bacterium]
MKKSILIFLFITSFSLSILAQVKINSITPGLYYTKGSYSNDNSSNSFSGYFSLQINQNNYLTFGYDNLKITNPAWEYAQDFFVIGGMKNFYPFYLKANLGYIKGNLNENDFTIYSDKINIYNLSILYNWNHFYFGGGATYQILSGLNEINTLHSELKIVLAPSKKFSFKLSPAITSASDDRELYSIGGELFYQPFNFFNFSVSGFVGERAFYFNPDNLTIYNQYETQKSSASLTFRALTNMPLNLIGSFQYTDFSDYQINYISVGLKYRFNIIK